MKKAFSLFIIVILTPIFGIAQSLDNLDFVSPFNDGVAAIEKDNQWAFINEEGTIVINFRNDVVITKTEDGNFPIFHDGRCLIVKKKDGIRYFGYIDTSGKTVIEPQYLNALNFDNGFATVLELVKEEAGRNDVLGKNAIYYKYYEATINTDGVVKNYLTPGGINIILDKKYLQKPPKFACKMISDNLVATKNKDGTWSVNTIN